MKYSLSDNLDLAKFKTKVAKLIEARKDVELKQIKQVRSIKSNAYLHVCITLFAMEFGYTIYESKTFLKRECNFMDYEKNGVRYLKETSKMDDRGISEFIEWIRNYAQGNGLYIPSPEEYLQYKIKIDKEIDKFKPYL